MVLRRQLPVVLLSVLLAQTTTLTCTPDQCTPTSTSEEAITLGLSAGQCDALREVAKAEITRMEDKLKTALRDFARIKARAYPDRDASYEVIETRFLCAPQHS